MVYLHPGGSESSLYRTYHTRKHVRSAWKRLVNIILVVITYSRLYFTYYTFQLKLIGETKDNSVMKSVAPLVSVQYNADIEHSPKINY
jgi:hypothetical protein